MSLRGHNEFTSHLIYSTSRLYKGGDCVASGGKKGRRAIHILSINRRDINRMIEIIQLFKESKLFISRGCGFVTWLFACHRYIAGNHNTLKDGADQVLWQKVRIMSVHGMWLCQWHIICHWHVDIWQIVPTYRSGDPSRVKFGVSADDTWLLEFSQVNYCQAWYNRQNSIRGWPTAEEDISRTVRYTRGEQLGADSVTTRRWRETHQHECCTPNYPASVTNESAIVQLFNCRQTLCHRDATLSSIVIYIYN